MYTTLRTRLLIGMYDSGFGNGSDAVGPPPACTFKLIGRKRTNTRYSVESFRKNTLSLTI
jgi:hypothetical protein